MPLRTDHTTTHNTNTLPTETKAFDITFAAGAEEVLTAQGVTLTAHISFKEAHKRLREFDVLVVPGGKDKCMEMLAKSAEPLALCKAFAELQTADPARERTLMAIDTAALFLAHQGLLQGLAATTHPDFYIKMEKECQNAAATDTGERTDVFKQTPRKGSNARKGSLARRESNLSKEYIQRRQSMKLGGMRVITCAGPVSGIDASLYLVSALVSHESAQEVARVMQYEWVKGVVVDAMDV